MNQTKHLIQAKDSNRRGILWSIATGSFVFVGIWMILAWALDFWYLGDVLGPVLGFIAGVLAGFAMFTADRRMEIRLKWQGVPTFLNDPAEEGLTFDTGTHWRPPLCGLIEVPGPDLVITMDLPGEEINTQDGSVVYVGMHQDESTSKSNRAQWQVIDPFKYVRVQNPKQEFNAEYLAKARFFFGEMKTAYAIKSERTLFGDFLMLPPHTEQGWEKVHGEFKTRLMNAKFKPSEKKDYEPIFARDEQDNNQSPAVEHIMSIKAGEFLELCTSWGIGKVVIFTPNVRENPEIEEAATQKAATSARMDTARLKVEAITEQTKGLAAMKVTPNLAALIVTSQIDPNSGVELRHQTFDVPQLRETVKAIEDTAADAVGKLAEMIRPKEVK